MSTVSYARDKVRVIRGDVVLFSGSDKAFDIWLAWHELLPTDEVTKRTTEWSNPWANRTPHDRFEVERA